MIDTTKRYARTLGTAGIVALLTAAALLPTQLTAQTSKAVATSIAPMEDLPDLRIQDGTVLLTLDEAIEIALQRNLGLYVERYNVQSSAYSLMSNLGIYDFIGRADLTAFEEQAPSASQLAGSDVQESEGEGWNFALSRLFSFGGEARVDFLNRRNEVNSQFATINPSFTSDLDFSFTQPLLRDLGSVATERNIRIARNNQDISRENFDIQVNDVIRAVSNDYWSLWQAIGSLDVAEESLTLANQLHEQNKVRVDVGTLAPLELVQSEAGVATRQEALIRARGVLGDAEDRLRQQLNVLDPRFWSAPIVPETRPETEEIPIDVQEGIASALQNRPEIISKRIQNDTLQIDAEYFANQARPRLDFRVAYGYNGLGGDVTEREFPSGEIINTTRGGYDDAIDQILNADFDGWNAALNFLVPIQNRTGRANQAIADLAVERGDVELANLELDITTAVRRTARAVEVAWEALQSARVSQRLEERNLDAENKRYDNGMSTSFQVLQIQEDLAEASQRLVSATTAYRQALVLYHLSIGQLMNANGVEVIDDNQDGS